jgi:hypothetical protein
MSTKYYLSAALIAFVFAFAEYEAPIKNADAAVATVRNYGPMLKLGDGNVRAYVTVDARNPTLPIEIGVALSEDAMENLPKAVPGQSEHAMLMHNSWDLQLPAQNPTPYKFVGFGWNPAGHEPPGVYDLPHFDFHFFRVGTDVKNSIMPDNPQWDAKSGAYPPEEQRVPFYIDVATAGKVPAGKASVPMMGMHWLDVRSPELQGMAGKPENFKQFTKTFLFGSWDGAFIFEEPMITRAYLLAKKASTDPAVRDELIPVPSQPKYALLGFYPRAYRISYDAKAKEYRVALTQLTLR